MTGMLSSRDWRAEGRDAGCPGNARLAPSAGGRLSGGAGGGIPGRRSATPTAGDCQGEKRKACLGMWDSLPQGACSDSSTGFRARWKKLSDTHTQAKNLGMGFVQKNKIFNAWDTHEICNRKIKHLFFKDTLQWNGCQKQSSKNMQHSTRPPGPGISTTFLFQPSSAHGKIFLSPPPHTMTNTTVVVFRFLFNVA